MFKLEKFTSFRKVHFEFDGNINISKKDMFTSKYRLLFF